MGWEGMGGVAEEGGFGGWCFLWRRRFCGVGWRRRGVVVFDFARGGEGMFVGFGFKVSCVSAVWLIARLSPQVERMKSMVGGEE